MPDCMPGDIEIGGRVTRGQWEKMVEAEGGLYEIEPGDNAPGTTLSYGDGDAAWGHFDELEGILRQEGIPYDRNANAKYEHNGEEASWRPGMDDELVASGAQDGGGITVPASDVVDWIERGLTLDQVLAEPNVDEGIRLLVLRRNQPLPPFEFIEEDEG